MALKTHLRYPHEGPSVAGQSVPESQALTKHHVRSCPEPLGVRSSQEGSYLRLIDYFITQRRQTLDVH